MIASQNGHKKTIKYLIDAKAQLGLQANASIDQKQNTYSFWNH